MGPSIALGPDTNPQARAPPEASGMCTKTTALSDEIEQFCGHMGWRVSLTVPRHHLTSLSVRFSRSITVHCQLCASERLHMLADSPPAVFEITEVSPLWAMSHERPQRAASIGCGAARVVAIASETTATVLTRDGAHPMLNWSPTVALLGHCIDRIRRLLSTGLCVSCN
jgi:hypothetical protein